MTLAKVGIVCLGVAFGLHAFIMNVGYYGAGGTTRDIDAGKGCQAMMILAFLMYGLAFLLALFGGMGEEAGYVASLAKPIVVAVLAGLGVVCFLVGMAVYGQYHINGAIISYHVATYTMAAVFALHGCFATVKNGISGGYSRES